MKKIYCLSLALLASAPAVADQELKIGNLTLGMPVEKTIPIIAEASATYEGFSDQLQQSKTVWPDTQNLYKYEAGRHDGQMYGNYYLKYTVYGNQAGESIAIFRDVPYHRYDDNEKPTYQETIASLKSLYGEVACDSESYNPTFVWLMDDEGKLTEIEGQPDCSRLIGLAKDVGSLSDQAVKLYHQENGNLYPDSSLAVIASFSTDTDEAGNERVDSFEYGVVDLDKSKQALDKIVADIKAEQARREAEANKNKSGAAL